MDSRIQQSSIVIVSGCASRATKAQRKILLDDNSSDSRYQSHQRARQTA